MLKKYQRNKIMLKTSITNEHGIEEVENEIAKMVYNGDIQSSENEYITNIRHINLIKKAFNSINAAIDATESEIGYDFIEIDINDTYSYLGEITGDTIGEDIISKIFSNFCLGK